MSFRGKLWTLALSGAVAVYAVVGGMPFVGGLLTTSAQQQPVNDSTRRGCIAVGDGAATAARHRVGLAGTRAASA